MLTIALSVGIVTALLALLGASLPRLYAHALGAAVRKLDAADYGEAARLATRALGIGSFAQVSAERAHFVRGLAFTFSGQMDLARGELDTAIRLKPDWAQAYYRRGALLLMCRELAAAIADLRVAIELDPKLAEAHIAAGRGLCVAGRYEEALLDCAAVIRLRPDDAEAQGQTGILQFCAGRFSEAAASLSRAVRFAPHDGYAVLWLHLARARAGEGDAKEYRDNAARIDRRSWPGVMVALDLGEIRVAEALAVAASGDEPGRSARLGQAAFFRGALALLKSETAEALSLLRQAQSAASHAVERVAAEIELRRFAPDAATALDGEAPQPAEAPLPGETPPRRVRGSVPSVPAAPGGFRPNVRGFGAWLAAAGVIGVKVLKSAKFLKFGLMVLSLGALALHAPFAAACAILYAIFVHESGHVLAMKACGMRTSGMYFLPFLGAVAVAKERARTRAQEWLIAIAGPAFGLLSLLPLLALAWICGSPEWALYAAFAALINLFNLLPIGILDGGRVVQAIAFSIAGWLGIVVFALGLAGGAYIVWHAAGGVLSIILVLSILEFVSAWQRHKTDPIPPMSGLAVAGATVAYLTLLVLFAFAFELFGAAAKGLGA